VNIEKMDSVATATERIEWAPVITGVVSTIVVLVLLIYATFYFFSRFYGCDCGDESSFFGSKMVQSDDQLWKDFGKCKIKMDRNLSYNITYITGVKALDGKEIAISGFMQPLEAKDKSRHFLLSKNAPTCAYCPPSRPNEIVEVFSSKPMAWKENLITLSGTLILVNDGKNGFFQIKNAVERQ
jgi:hypothetical protein